MRKSLYNVPFSVPKATWEHANKPAPYDTHYTFLELQEHLLDDFHCKGGLLNNWGRIYILDQKGNYNTVQFNKYAMVQMEAAAVDGRLMFRDLRNKLHQICLTPNEEGEYDFTVSEAIEEPVVPPRPEYYFIKNLLGKFFSYFNAMVEDYNNWKSFSDATNKFLNDYNKGVGELARIHYAKPKVQEPQPEVVEVKENEVEVKEAEVKEAEVKQPEVKEAPIEPQLTAEELLEMNPMQMTAAQFESYLGALQARNVVNKNGESLAMAVINDPNSTPDEYYEAVTQELLGEAAKTIAERLDTSSAERKNQIIEQQKPIFASMARGLKAFVWNYPERENKELVTTFFRVRAANAAGEQDPAAAAYAEQYNLFTLKVGLLNDLVKLQGDGVTDYLEAVKQQGEIAKQAQQANQPQPSVQMQVQIQPEPQPMGMGGPGGPG